MTLRVRGTTAVRADLMTAIRGQIDCFGWSQVVAAQNLGVTQPRLSDLYRGKLSKFSLDVLVDLGSKVGVQVDTDTDTLLDSVDAVTRSGAAHAPMSGGFRSGCAARSPMRSAFIPLMM